jgi:hypothetical protein
VAFMKICPTCQQAYSDDVEFCPRDGARLSVKLFGWSRCSLIPVVESRISLSRRGGVGHLFRFRTGTKRTAV